MEQFLLGIFQEQLSKIIVGFRKEQVNASLLNGKGEITDVSLNCAFMNEKLSKVTPFVQFESIHLSKLGFHVTSWTNLRKAPIVIDIENITATIHEPLHYVDKTKRRTLKMLTEGELLELMLAGLWKPTRNTGGSYGILDRIIDNVTIEIEKVTINYQTWGKFKTTRIGPWTPPLLQVQLRHLKVVSVDEFGQEGTPDEVWAHNRHQHTNYMLYKKISLNCNVNIVPTNIRNNNRGATNESISVDIDDPIEGLGGEDRTIRLVNDAKVEVQIAFRRRIQDGAFLAVQLDATIPHIEIEIEPHAVPPLAHLASGIQYCLAKDRSFEDPLRPASEDKKGDDSKSSASPLTVRSASQGSVGDVFTDESGDEEDNSDTFEGNDELNLEEAENASSSSSDEGEDIKDIENDDGTASNKVDSSSAPVSEASYKKRPIVLLPNGAVIHESISITFSIHHVTVRGSYPTSLNGYVQLVAKGCIAELIWPKIDNEKGCYIQFSASYLSLQERHGPRIRTILIGGMAQFASEGSRGPLEQPDMPPREVNADENFPLFERRSVRDDPLDLRHTFPSQAVGLKTTVDFLKSTQQLSTSAADAGSSVVNSDRAKGPNDNTIFVLHELGIDKFDIVLDSDAWCRALKFVLNESGGGFDPRWSSGDWSDCLTVDMLRTPSGALELEHHIQGTKQIMLDENSMISSDLFNVTARIVNVEVRLPAAIHENARSTDVVLILDETMLIVSSALPRTFLSGKLGNSINGDESDNKGIIDFPNDPSDIAYALEQSEDPSLRQQGVMTSKNVSTFRLQLTMRGFSVRAIPVIPFCVALEPQQLLAPTDLTMIICFEGEPPERGANYVEIVLFVSIQVHRFRINLDLDLIAGAASSLVYHVDIVKSTIEQARQLLPTKSTTSGIASTEQRSERTKVLDGNPKKVKKNLRGRRVMVRRQFNRSRETGGLRIVFCLQLAEFAVTLWRQNVPLVSPFRRCPSSSSIDLDAKSEFPKNATTSCSDEANLNVLRLIEFLMKEFEIAVEFAFHANETRRTVVKCCLGEVSLKVCDLSSEINAYNTKQATPVVDNDTSSSRKEATFAHTQAQVKANASEKSDMRHMVDILSFGGAEVPGTNNLPGSSRREQQFALRLEEQLKDKRSWSLAADVTSPTRINLHVDEIKDVSLMIIEALLLPTWSKRAMEPKDGAPFPPKTIGYFLCSFIPQRDELLENAEFRWDREDSKVQDSGDAVVERLLRYTFDVFLPSDLRLVLLRLELGNLLIALPSKKLMANECKPQETHVCLLLNQMDIVVRFFPVNGSDQSDLLDVLACKGVPWSSLIETEADGFYHKISSRQSLLSVLPNNSSTADVLVSPFDVSFSYAASRVSVSMDNKLLVEDLKKIEGFVWQLLAFSKQCKSTKSELLRIFSAIRQPSKSGDLVVNEEEGSKTNIQVHAGSGENFMEVTSLVRSGRVLLRRLNEEMSSHDLAFRKALQQKEEEVENLKYLVFAKEKERFGALSLMSSRVAGWIRMGGLHRHGERILKTTTMVLYWAVIRKSILLLYSNPGNPKPSDVVLLDGCQLRRLAGGKSKQDTKRGFAVIENTGTTRFFITRSSPELSLWTREIQKVVDANAGNGNMVADASGADIPMYDANAEHVDVSLKSVEDDNVDHAGGTRRMRFGTRIAGVRQATKSRIGSALQNARQKGKEAVVRRRLNSADSSEFSADVIEDGNVIESDYEDDVLVEADSGVLDRGGIKNPSLIIDSEPVATADSAGSDRDVVIGTEGVSVPGVDSSHARPEGEDEATSGTNNPGISSISTSADSKNPNAEDASEYISESGVTDRSAEEAAVLASGSKMRMRLGSNLTRIGSALQTARQKGKEVVERQRLTSDATPENPTRVLPGIRSRFTRQSTSSLSAGDDNELESTARSTAASASIDGVTNPEFSTEAWSCNVCTFINNSENLPTTSTSCEMCGSPRMKPTVSQSSIATTESDPNRIEGPDQSEDSNLCSIPADNALSQPPQKTTGAATASQDEENGDTNTLAEPASDDAERTGLRLGMRERLGNFAANRNARLNRADAQATVSQNVASTRSNRFMFRRKGSDCEGASVHEGGSTTLKNIRVSDTPTFEERPSVRIETGGKSANDDVIVQQLVPLKKFEGNWIVLVKSCWSLEIVGSNDPSTYIAANKEANAAVAPEDVDFDSSKDGDVDGIPSRQSTESLEKLVDGDSQPSGDSFFSKGVNALQNTESRKTFRIQIFRGDSKEKDLVVERYCSLADMLALHTQISESLLRILPQASKSKFESDRSGSGEMNSHLALRLGLSSFDSIKVAGRLLGGLLEMKDTPEIVQKTHEYQADIIEAFLTAIMACPLPIEALAVLTEVLGISASTQDVRAGEGIGYLPSNGKRNNENLKHENVGMSSAISKNSLTGNSTKILGLLSACETELLRAENREVAPETAVATTPGSSHPTFVAGSSTSPLSTLHDPLLPPSVTEHFHDAMHEALMKVMAERDEAHAQLIAASVLHVHELEQERKKNELLEKKLKTAEILARSKPSGPQFFGNNTEKPRLEAEARLEKYQRQMAQNSDEELVALCQQLAGEISAKTSAALEILRLKESRDIERKKDAAEKQALKDELRRTKDLLAVEHRKSEEALQERNNWRQTYEKIVATQNRDGRFPSD